MSENNDPPPPQNPPDEPPSSPFPESSLTPPPLPPQEPGAPAPPPSDPPSQSFGVPTPAPPAPPQDPAPGTFGGPPPEAPPATGWMQPSAPQAPAPAEPVAPSGGLISGDPLGGSSPSTGASAFPAGYTSPPPPGAGGSGSASFGNAPAPGTYVLAGWWRRVGAAVIDGIIVSVLALVILVPLGIGIFSTADINETDTDLIGQMIGFFVSLLVFSAVALAYAPVMMGKTNGKTLGRMATGIRVVRADGKAITVGFAAVREVAVKALLIGAVAGSFTFGLASLLDVLWPLWDDENRALHDFVVNTRTVMDG